MTYINHLGDDGYEGVFRCSHVMSRDLKQRFTQADWDAAKDEARAIMIERAKVRGIITYSDLVEQIERLKIEAYDTRLFHMLDEISSEEDAAGRGMLSVLVVHKVGDKQPGPGFFKLAKQLGRNTSNVLKCWAEELQKVYAIWSGQ